MKNNGFTLIELLAVLVIISFIALIAIPSISGVINNAKKKTAEESARGYINAVNKQINFGTFENTSKRFTDGVYLLPLSDEYGVKVKGKKPIAGWIVVKDDKIVEYSISFDDYTVTVDKDAKKTIEVTNKDKLPSPPEQVNTKPDYQYYYVTDGNVDYSYGDQVHISDFVSSYDEILKEGHSKYYKYFIKAKIDNNTNGLEDAELCLHADSIVTSQETCFKYGKSNYENNASYILAAFAGLDKSYLKNIGRTYTKQTNMYTETASCSIYEDKVSCTDKQEGDFDVVITVFKNGSVNIEIANGQSSCRLYNDSFSCY